MARGVRGIDAVVIGASAGGIEALTSMLPALRPGFRQTLIIVQHLPRERPSLLPGLFAAKCQLPVIEATDKVELAPGTVYLAPPDYHLLVDGNPPHLALSIDPPVHFSRPSIDVLFESAADVYAHRLLGIVLSGSNADGAQGLAAVKKMGGVTAVQDPATALFSTMPAAALARGRADFVLSIEALGGLLKELAGSSSEWSHP